MIEFERSTDYKLIRSVLTHRRVWPHITDDGSPDIGDFQPVEHESFYYVTCRDGGELLGLFLFIPENFICYSVHTALLPVAWGKRAKECGCGVRDWMWANSLAHRIVTSVPESNTLALRFARDCGLRAYGRNPKSILKGGRLQDIILLGVSRPAEFNFSEPEAIKGVEQTVP